MTGQYANTDDLEELAGLIHFRVGAWQDFGYENPPTPSSATIPPLGERSVNAIQAGHEALKGIDELIARLHRVRAQLADELRQDENIRAGRASAPPEAEAPPGRDVPACPACRADASHIGWLGADGLHAPDRWRCTACDHEWQTPDPLASLEI